MLQEALISIAVGLVALPALMPAFAFVALMSAARRSGKSHD